jgi:hypothetical protein
MGTITGISDLDPVRWKNSQWRNLQVRLLATSLMTVLVCILLFMLYLIHRFNVIWKVGWDESAAGERRNRVSMWEIEPIAAPFFICPQPFFGVKRPRQSGKEALWFIFQY